LLSLLPLAPAAPPQLHPLSLHDALPICQSVFVTPQIATSANAANAARRTTTLSRNLLKPMLGHLAIQRRAAEPELLGGLTQIPRSEEHTSELQSRENLVCRLLLEKKKVT